MLGSKCVAGGHGGGTVSALTGELGDFDDGEVCGQPSNIQKICNGEIEKRYQERAAR